MSVVTNVVLLTDIFEDEALTELREFLCEGGFGELVQVDEHAGGTKIMEVDVYLGAFNHFPESPFVERFRTASWERPDVAVLLLETEGYATRLYLPER